MDLIRLCAVVGPTASGKTALAVELAKKLQGEVVSFDSMQVYREAPIATAIPTEAERQGIPHHLINFLTCDDSFSVAQYTALADQAIAGIRKRGGLPVLVGGTGLYYTSLVDHITFAEQPDDIACDIRKNLYKRLNNEGIEPLYRELQKVDPAAAESIHINNHVRVLRALEVYYATGKPISVHKQESRREPSPYLPCVIGLDYRDRSRLYARIDRRVDQMLKAGLLDEIGALLEQHPGGTLLQAIGIKEWIPYFQGTCSLEQAAETVRKETRHYAKRQLTWFRRDPRVHWLMCDSYDCFDDIVSDAVKVYKDFAEEAE